MICAGPRRRMIGEGPRVDWADGHGGVPIFCSYEWASMPNNMTMHRNIFFKQVKGASETHPLLLPTDEFSGFEIWSNLPGDPSDRVPHIVGSYAWRVGTPEAKLTRGSEPPSSIRGEMSP